MGEWEVMGGECDVDILDICQQLNWLNVLLDLFKGLTGQGNIEN